jgi:hypothetical protein
MRKNWRFTPISPRFAPYNYFCLVDFFSLDKAITERARLFTGDPTIKISRQTAQIGV